MAKTSLTTRQMVAFKIGARARKFATEGCPIEGYEMLYSAIAEAKTTGPEMASLLEEELTKFEKKVASLDEAEEPLPHNG